MMQVWRGYTNDVQEIVSKTMDPRASIDHTNGNNGA
jgi:hypothetical protein